ncbi:MAG: 4-alpha-glucanotransferase [Candidatus Eremiobacteraeota bacterium]|nr:4-alpha-glucanotransferase [Candidatus Eremiobacteraeota bacterium]
MREAHAYLPPVLAAGRAWGFGVNLYALRSQRNWGIGDFTDLRGFVRYARAAGADTVGINPVHALHYGAPEAASPYSPTSRYFLNPLYIDVEAVPEYRNASTEAVALRARIASPAFARTLADLRSTATVAYGRVAEAKYPAFEALLQIFRNGPAERRAAFDDFCERRGRRLERFATYEALGERFTREGDAAGGWLEWPAEFRDAGGSDVSAWAARNPQRIAYFKYLQWIANEQLAAASDEARSLAIGLYLDVAVGVDADSADVWSDPRAYVLEETIGAPPDELGPLGQNWGLPPLDPGAMLSDDGATFAELLRSNMQHAGALRLDHAMALMRLFRIPRGQTAVAGAYVPYPFDELLAIAARESVWARCLIIGEDLGTVPEGFRERMEREAIFSYRVLLFEREPDGRFKPPAAYPALSLATATTHDVPTLAGWSIGRDLDARERAGMLSREAADTALGKRRRDASLLVETLRDRGELEAAAGDRLERTIAARAPERAEYAPLIRAAYRYLAASRSSLVLVQLDDALCELEQVNLPGTLAEYPNWRRKSALDLDGIARDADLAALAHEVSARVKGSAPQ